MPVLQSNDSTLYENCISRERDSSFVYSSVSWLQTAQLRVEALWESSVSTLYGITKLSQVDEGGNTTDYSNYLEISHP